jgi:membrane-bound lytic murein transglycosylase B
MKLKKILLTLLTSVSFSILANDYQQLVSDVEVEKSIRAFSQQMAIKHQFDEQAVYNTLSNLKHSQDIIQKMTRPAESVMPWFKYQKIWMKDQRINEGIEFWEKHKTTLERAQEKYGVAPEIIVSIIGVETFYGRIQGTYPVLEALHTLGFYYPKRSTFFKNELVEYFLLARTQGWKLNEIKGSYAGAMGMGQFISSSYRQYAVDFNGDGKINLFDDPVDMIGSVANYFKRHHWQKNGFIVEPVKLKQAQLKLIQHQLKQTHSIEKLKNSGIDTINLENRTDKAGVYAFEKSDTEKEYWLGGKNFYVITRYNHNKMYALAVFQLSEAIKEKMNNKNP